ncbi:MAG TPA: VOC family protein [Polyangia bacterium]|jgi:catechol 2,3-dioxygenase-like lactoylglutathione lyase family enzyme|nr:VOC family protein [Polyangia bacterium]
MTIVAIDHVQLAMPVGGEAEARAFYAGLLGLTGAPRPPELARRGGAWFENQHVKIHVGVDPDFHPARKAHPALVVRDLKLLTDRLRAAGAALSTDRSLPGFDRIFVHDPFGNRIELLEPVP